MQTKAYFIWWPNEPLNACLLQKNIGRYLIRFRFVHTFCVTIRNLGKNEAIGTIEWIILNFHTKVKIFQIYFKLAKNLNILDFEQTIHRLLNI